jgi:thiamine pyrophosphokinase
VILGNGEPPSAGLFAEVMAGDPLLLAADGGANTASRLGRIPDWVIGDLDSADPAGLAGVAVERRVRVDADDTGTDLQKALGLARRLGVAAVDLLGCTGRRVDHTLWNLSLLRTWDEEMRLRFLDDYCETRLIRSQVRFRAPLGQRLSLCPLAGPVTGIHTQGLRFPLRGEGLIPGVRDGISNEVTADPVEISVADGDLLLVIQREGATGPITWEVE